MSHVITRGIGLDTRITPDYGDGALETGDRFLLASDGIWSALDTGQLQQRLAGGMETDAAPGDTAAALCDLALRAGSQDNVSAVVMHVTALPDDAWADVITRGADLPPPPILKPGQELDGFRVEETLHRSITTVVYRAPIRTINAAWY